ncbi:hypothetical protein QTP88_022057 [Uroleucon formosanum]
MDKCLIINNLNTDTTNLTEMYDIVLSSIRINADIEFQILFLEVEQKLNLLDETIQILRITGCQLSRNFYKHVLPSYNTFESELKVWIEKWKKVPQNEFPKSAIDTFNKVPPDFFPNIWCLMSILATLSNIYLYLSV